MGFPLTNRTILSDLNAQDWVIAKQVMASLFHLPPRYRSDAYFDDLLLLTSAARVGAVLHTVLPNHFGFLNRRMSDITDLATVVEPL